MSTAIRVDVAVVGAGPAGMAAALAAADLGCRVVLVDASPAMGGQIYRPPASGGVMDGPRAGAPADAAPAPAGGLPSAHPPLAGDNGLAGDRTG